MYVDAPLHPLKEEHLGVQPQGSHQWAPERVWQAEPMANLGESTGRVDWIAPKVPRHLVSLGAVVGWSSDLLQGEAAGRVDRGSYLEISHLCVSVMIEPGAQNCSPSTQEAGGLPGV